MHSKRTKAIYLYVLFECVVCVCFWWWWCVAVAVAIHRCWFRRKPQPCFSHCDRRFCKKHYMTSRISRMLSLLPQRLLAPLYPYDAERFCSSTFSAHSFLWATERKCVCVCVYRLHLCLEFERFFVIFSRSSWQPRARTHTHTRKTS